MSCGCDPVDNVLCAEARRLSKRASALTPSVTPKHPKGPDQYEAWSDALDAYWWHIRPESGARYEVGFSQAAD